MQIRQMNYEDYVSLQKEKTEDPERRRKWLLNREANSRKFVETFRQDKVIQALENIQKDSKIVCIGARTGEEVLALHRMGYENAIGVDLVPCDELVIEGDMHDLPFEDNSVRFIYCNVIDHSLQPNKFLQECRRILKKSADDVNSTVITDCTSLSYAFFQLQVGTAGDKYGVNAVESADQFSRLVEEHMTYKKLCNGIQTFRNSVLTPHNHGLNWNVLVELTR